MTIKRSIRLKEFIPNIEKIHCPSVEYLAKTPQLLKNEAFFQRVNGYGMMEHPCGGDEDFTIVFLGDSFIENIFVKESNRFTNLLQEKFFSLNQKIKVYNAGVSGATGLGLLNVFLNKIIPMKPDIVVYTQPSCDFSSLIYEKGYYNDSQLFSNLTPSVGQERFYYETIEPNLSQLEHNIHLLAKSCEINNIQLYVATCCSNSSKRQLKMMNDIMRNNIHLGYKLIDLDLIVSRDDKYFYDKQHINANGSQFLYEVFYSALSEDKLVKERYVHSSINYFERNIIEDIILLDNNICIDVAVSNQIKSYALILELDEQSESFDYKEIEVNIIIEGYKEGSSIERIVKKIKHPMGYCLEQSIICIFEQNIDKLYINLSSENKQNLSILSLKILGKIS